MKEGGFRGNTTVRGMSASRPVTVREAPRTKEFSIPMIKVPDMRPGSADSIRLSNNRAKAGHGFQKEGPGKLNRFMETTWSSAGNGEVPFDRKFNVQPIKPSIKRKGRDKQRNFSSLQSEKSFINEGPVKPFALRNSQVEHSFGKTTSTNQENKLQAKNLIPSGKVDVQNVDGDKFVRNYNPNEFRIEARNKKKPESVNPNLKFAAERRDRTQERNLPKNREVVLFRRRIERVNTKKSFEKLNGKARFELLRKLRQERKAQRTNPEQSMNFYNSYKDTFRKGENMEMRPVTRLPEQKIQPRPNDLRNPVRPTVDQRLQSIRGELAKLNGLTTPTPEQQTKVAIATYWKKDSTQKLNTQSNRVRLLAVATKTATRLVELQKKSAQPSVENKPLQRTAVKTQVETQINRLQQLATKTQLVAKEKLELLRKKKDQLITNPRIVKEKEHGYTKAEDVAKNRINYLINAVRRQKESKTQSPVLIPDRQRSFQSRFKIILDGLFPDGSIIRTNNETAGLHNARNLSDLKKKAEDLVKKYPPVKVIEKTGEVSRSYVQSVILGKQKEERNKNAITA